VPRILAENAGMDPTEAITKLYARHEAEDGVNFGVNVDVCILRVLFVLFVYSFDLFVLSF
jgi:hypothetical protein